MPEYRKLASLAGWAVFLVVLVGCTKETPPPVEAIKVPEVTVTYPARTSIQWTVQQPGTVQAFEETPIVPKIPGYVQKWNVDIGDRVREGEVLAELWIPDLVADLNQKKVEVEQARKMLEVAHSHVASATASVPESQAALERARANLKFWQMQYGRIAKLDRTVIDKQVKEESFSQLKSAEASVREAEAKVTHAEADRKESEAARSKSQVDITVAESARAKMQALVDYATLSAPFDGVVTQRNINRGDFVQPPASGQKEPLYVVQRRDLMRIFVEVPESDAVWVKDGASVRIRIPVLKNQEYTGTVRRMSYSLKRQSRTLLAEIDLPNPDDLLRPGMYATAIIQVERSNILTLPTAAVATRGDVNEGYQNFCFVVENGKVHRIPVEVGASGDKRVEVLKKQVEGAWQDFTGAEKVVQGNLSSLTDGQEAHVSLDEHGTMASSPHPDSGP